LNHWILLNLLTLLRLIQYPTGYNKPP
jgi:hypothetical protein